MSLRASEPKKFKFLNEEMTASTMEFAINITKIEVGH